MGEWKRSDISSEVVLTAYSQKPGIVRVDEYLMKQTGAPLKVVWAAMERECELGFVDYGVSLCAGWLILLKGILIGEVVGTLTNGF